MIENVINRGDLIPYGGFRNCPGVKFAMKLLGDQVDKAIMDGVDNAIRLSRTSKLFVKMLMTGLHEGRITYKEFCRYVK